MTDRYHLVGCSDCGAFWIRDCSEDSYSTTTECSRCGNQYRIRKLRTFASSDDVSTLKHERGERLAEQAGQRDVFEADMADLATRENAAGPDGDLFYPVLDTGEAWFADVKSQVEAYFDAFQIADEGWIEQQRERRQTNDRVWEDHFEEPDDPFADLVDDEIDAAEPDWHDPEFGVTFPGGTAPIDATATVTIGPRFSEWVDDLLDQLLLTMARAVREHAHDRVEEHASIRDPSVIREILVEDAGITALGGDYAPSLARYAVEAAEYSEDERAALRKALTTVGSPGGAYATGVDALREGPLAALTLAEDEPTVVVRFDAPAWKDAYPDTAQRALDVLRDLARAVNDHLVVSSTGLARTLSDYDLPDVDFTEALGAARHASTEDEREPTLVERAWAGLEEPYDDGHGDLRILATLPDDGPRYQASIVADPDVDLGKSAVSRALSRLEDHGLVDRGRDGNRKMVRLTPLGDAAGACIDPDGFTLVHPDHSDLGGVFTGPPQRSVGTVYSAQQARRRGEAGRSAHRPSPEQHLVDTDAIEDGADYVQWLSGPSARVDAYAMHRRITAPAAGTVTTVDAPISDWSNDHGGGKVTYLSAFEDEVLVLVQWGGPLVTLGRIVNALLSPKAFSKLVGPEATGWEFEDLRAGVDGPAFKEFDEEVATILRDGMQLGWFSEDEHEWESFRDRIGGVRALCLEKLGQLAGSEDWEARGELMRDLHGLLASATGLYWSAGLDVVVNIRAPDTANIAEDELRRRDFLNFFRYAVPKQALYRSVTGLHSHNRQAHETRPEKREWRLDLGFDADLEDVDDELQDIATDERGNHRLTPESDPTVQWIVTGRTATELRPAIERAIDEEVAERVEAGEERAPYLDVEVVNGNAYRSIKRIVREIASAKRKQVAETSAAQQAAHAESLDRLVRLCITATSTGDRPHEGNPYTVAEALLTLARSTRGGDFLSVSDLEYAFSQVHPDEFLPALSPTASAFVQLMLDRDEPVTRSEALEATGHSESSWERALSGTDTSAALRTLGLVEETTKNGTPAYTATLAPWWLNGRDPVTGAPASDRQPPESGGTGPLTPASLERDLVLELATAVDVPADLLDALAWPPDVGAVYQHPEVSAWRAWIWAAVASGDEYETGPPDVPSLGTRGVVRLGVSPDDIVLEADQTMLASSATVQGGAGEAIPQFHRRRR